MLPIQKQSSPASSLLFNQQIASSAQKLSNPGKIILDSLEQMNLTDNKHKLKITGTHIQQRGLNEAGGETFNKAALESFCGSLNTFISSPLTPFNEIELAEAAIPKAIQGLKFLEEEVYKKQYATKENSFLEWVTPGMLRDSHSGEINYTINCLEKILKQISKIKEQIIDLRSAGVLALTEDNYLHSKDRNHICRQLKNWGVLDLAHPQQDLYANLCIQLQKFDNKCLSKHEKYELLAACVFLKNKSSDFEDVVKNLCAQLESIAEKRGKTNENKRKDVQELLKTTLDKHLESFDSTDSLDALLKSFVLVNENPSEILAISETQEDASTSSFYSRAASAYSALQKISALPPYMYDGAISLFGVLKEMPNVHENIKSVGKIVELMRAFSKGGITDPVVVSYAIEEIKNCVRVQVIKDPSHMLYNVGLNEAALLDAEAFAKLASGLEDAEFNQFISDLNKLGLLDKVKDEDLPLAKKAVIKTHLHGYFLSFFS